MKTGNCFIFEIMQCICDHDSEGKTMFIFFPYLKVKVSDIYDIAPSHFDGDDENPMRACVFIELN